jgi:4-diphosphocytidyl-2-C-methyl-D-erythritol kinase
MTVREVAPAKVNLLLHVAPPRGDGLHPLCSLFASIDLADEVAVEPADADVVECAGVAGPNLAERAVAVFRAAVATGCPPGVRVRIEKRIPVAAGLGGGSADAAATLRAVNELSGRPLGAPALRGLGAGLGADVPSQVEPRHALVTGVGERVEPLDLPEMALVLVPQAEGLSTAAVYAEADRIGVTRQTLDPDAVRALAARPLAELAQALDNDLQRAAVSLRPDLEQPLARLRAVGALAALVTGSGPTTFGVFQSRAAAEGAAATIPGSLVSTLRR